MDTSENLNLNAVCLQNAVLCADCEVISDSPHDTCVVCGSRSLLSVSRVLGGTLPMQRAQLVDAWNSGSDRPTFLLEFQMPHYRARRPVA